MVVLQDSVVATRQGVHQVLVPQEQTVVQVEQELSPMLQVLQD
jgi:hypothetical protein